MYTQFYNFNNIFTIKYRVIGVGDDSVEVCIARGERRSDEYRLALTRASLSPRGRGWSGVAV